MRMNTQEAVLSAYIASIAKRTPREAAQDAAELCRLANSLNRLRVSGFVLTNPEPNKTRSPATAASRNGKSGASKIYKPGSRPGWNARAWSSTTSTAIREATPCTSICPMVPTTASADGIAATASGGETIYDRIVTIRRAPSCLSPPALVSEHLIPIGMRQLRSEFQDVALAQLLAQPLQCVLLATFKRAHQRLHHFRVAWKNVPDEFLSLLGQFQHSYLPSAPLRAGCQPRQPLGLHFNRWTPPRLPANPAPPVQPPKNEFQVLPRIAKFLRRHRHR